MKIGFNEPIRISARANEKAFLQHFERCGYKNIIGWMAENNLTNEPIDVILEELSLLDKNGFARAVGPMTSTTEGANNVIFGASAFSQIIKGKSAIGVLGKSLMQHSGFRAEVAQSSTDLPGIAEGAELPVDVVADYAEVTVGAKDLVHNTAISFLHLNLQNKDDVLDVGNQIEAERQTYMNRLNRNVLYDCNIGSPGEANMNSLHCLTESYAHIAAAGLVANAADFYNIDRDAAASWADSYVNYNIAVPNTPRNLSTAFIDDVIKEVGKYRLSETSPYGEGFILTGYNTEAALTQLIEPKHLLKDEWITVGINGINTAPGREGSVRVNMYKGQPIILDAHMPAPNGGLDDMLFLDSSVTRLSVLQETRFYRSENPFIANGLKDRYMWHMQANVLVTKPKANGKLTDIM